MIKLIKKINYGWAIMFIIYFCILLSFVKSGISTDNYIYAIEELHTFDSNLYLQNPAISKHMFTPRLLGNHVVSTLMKCGITWEMIILILRYCSVFLYTVAVYLFARYIFKYAYSGILLALFMSLDIAGGLAGFYIYEVMNVFIGLGCSLVYIALFMVINEYFNQKTNESFIQVDIAWILVSTAACIHIHEGLYGGCILLSVQIAMSLFTGHNPKKLRGCIIWLCTITACILPNLLTDTVTWSENYFVNIYAILRHPWHMMPSYFLKWGYIIAALLPFLLPLCDQSMLCSIKTTANWKKKYMAAGVIFFTYILALMIMYIFTEIYPVSFIPTLCISKYFKYVSFIGVLIYVYMINQNIKSKKIISTIAIFVIALLSIDFEWKYIVVLYLIIFIQNYFIKSKKIRAGSDIVLSLVIIVALTQLTIKIQLKAEIILVIGLLISVFIYQCNNRFRKIILNIAVLMMIVISLKDRLYYLESSAPYIKLNSAMRELQMEATEDIYTIGTKFCEQTNKDEIFLIDPYDNNGGWLQLVSRRSAYALWKTVPSSKKSIEIWYNRVLEIKNISKETSENVYNIMKKIDCGYIMVPKEKYVSYENNKKYSLFLDSASYRMYKIK